MIIRLLFFLSLLALELIAGSVWFDGSLGRTSLALWLRGTPVTPGLLVEGAVAFTVFLLVFCGSAQKRGPQGVEARELPPVSIRLLVAHAATMGGVWWMSGYLIQTARTSAISHWLSMVYASGALLAVALAALAFLPLAEWWRLAQGKSDLVVYALFASVAAIGIATAAELLWKPVTALTFESVRRLTGLLLDGVSCDVVTRHIGTPRFGVRVGARCSDLEGIGLTLVFSSTWLWFFRREYRFPRALLLLPAGVLLIWAFNILRISALIVMGHFGAEKIALGGFHSQAGWIAFLTVALLTAHSSRKVGWIGSAQGEPAVADQPRGGASATEYYLMPFLAVLASTLISRTLSGDFEWLYALRFIGAAAVLWHYRRHYRQITWSVSWQAAALGALVFAVWIGAERMMAGGASVALGEELAKLSPAARFGWLSVRVAAATLSVPVAEELAFRGFLLRRLAAPDFESVDPRRFSLVAFLISSAAFGILHGERWPAGCVAGMIYAVAYQRRGSMGDAAFAHATTNAMLAAWVLWTGSWQYW